MTARKKAPVAPTSADAWGSAEPKLYELPSGKAMRLRHGPCMGRLVREGVIPNPLLGAVLEIQEDGATVKTGMDWKAREEHVAAIVCAMCVEPPVTMEFVEGAVVYDSLDEDDVEFILTLARGGVPALAAFRSE